MAIGILIIGDEILSGRRADQHFSKVVQLLAARGLQLSWAQYLSDDTEGIAATLKRTFASGDIVFSFGGIGATPDDHTRQAAADALGLPLVLHEQGKRNIQQRITEMGLEAGIPADLNTPENLHRLKMAEFAEGAELIPNPYNKIAGFSLKEHYFVPGFPVMAWPMIEWVLDTKYPQLFNRVPHAEHALLVYETAESALTPLMVALEAQFPLVKVFSLPSVGDAVTRRHIELGVKGEPRQAAQAFAAMRAELDRLRAEYQTIQEPVPTGISP
ncbi:competence/damage-inducible protein A [Janthinobacterium agaricidamnosum]|uniref:Putative molybdopterin binding domain protein n=1 Tax=Janthinobacterium agaricidamnosum NBRC 102515 = DSM 9628 TaxID=1349767 RepID=W0VCE3_9BURK|nr:molybdopterin-binding protein [Janthinobacterium agaricidamnosum]CDG84952.1 putative molybdopterin binding domain protein [Janthinobacterium agaricidamnosum NBRC 102515 = DSM 9628]